MMGDYSLQAQDFYNPEWNGVVFDSRDATSSELSQDKFRGYIQKDALVDLIRSVSRRNCAGLRIYNIHLASGDVRVLAAPVDKKGFDMKEIYYLSGRIGPEVKPANKLTRRSSAESAANLTATRKDKFASFFSINMLNELLNQPGVDGLAFYTLQLDFIQPDRVSSLNTERKNVRFSHVAFGVQVKGGQIENAQQLSTQTGRLSDLPCPGKCIIINADNSVGVGENVVNRGTQSSGSAPYLIRWN